MDAAGGTNGHSYDTGGYQEPGYGNEAYGGSGYQHGPHHLQTL